MAEPIGFEERRKIELLLHPEKRSEEMFRPGFVEPTLLLPGNETDPYQNRWTEAQGPLGSATRHITGHYDTTRGDFDPNKSVGTLDSEKERLRALNEMTQQQSGVGTDAQSPFRCGASVLLAGSLLAGGGDGIASLINSVEAFKKGSVKGELDEATKKQMEELDKIKHKIARGKELTAGDLGRITDDVFELLKKTRPDGSKTDGMLDSQVTALMASSPELREMWKARDLSYDSVDPTGAGMGGHAVLGIGHGTEDKEHVGPHQAIYDPYHRKTRDQSALDRIADARRMLESCEKGTYGYIVATQQLDLAVNLEKASRKEAGQLITDAGELATYKQATDASVEFDAPTKGGIDPHTYYPANIWTGMY